MAMIYPNNDSGNPLHYILRTMFCDTIRPGLWVVQEVGLGFLKLLQTNEGCPPTHYPALA